MNKQEAYTKFCERNDADQANDPWEAVFHAGWDACMEAQKQTTLFPLPEAESDKHLSCKQGEAGAIPVRSCSITAEDIYAAYPRKVGRGAALKAIKKAIDWAERNDQWNADLGATLRGGSAFIIAKTQAYAAAVAQWKPEERQYCPHPATWFNQERYLDDPAEWSRGTAPASQFSRSH